MPLPLLVTLARQIWQAVSVYFTVFIFRHLKRQALWYSCAHIMCISNFVSKFIPKVSFFTNLISKILIAVPLKCAWQEMHSVIIIHLRSRRVTKELCSPLQFFVVNTILFLVLVSLRLNFARDKDKWKAEIGSRRIYSL